MTRSLLTALCLAACVLTVTAQPPACNGYTMTFGWDETLISGPLTTNVGPEDIAFNPMSHTLFVAHDVAGSNSEILEEFDLEGNLLQVNVNLPGAGGLTHMPNSPNLLTTNGSSIFEVDPTGTLVPGGINVNIPGYGNIQDLDWDNQGRLWIHNGNNGDYSIVDLTTQTATTQFLLGWGSQSMTFDPSGNILGAVAFFNTGGQVSGAFYSVDQTGNVVCMGTPSGSYLKHNEDPCGGGGNFGNINGMTWIPDTNELAIDNYFVTGPPVQPNQLAMGVNVARFAPDNTAFISRIGLPGYRQDTLPFTLSATGDAVIGGSGFTLSVRNPYMGNTLIWGISTMRNCGNPTFGTNGSTLYIDINPQNLIFQLLLSSATPTLTIPIDLSGLGPAAAGATLFTQFAGNDVLAPSFDLLLSEALRVRFDLQ